MVTEKRSWTQLHEVCAKEPALIEKIGNLNEEPHVRTLYDINQLYRVAFEMWNLTNTDEWNRTFKRTFKNRTRQFFPRIHRRWLVRNISSPVFFSIGFNLISFWKEIARSRIFFENENGLRKKKFFKKRENVRKLFRLKFHLNEVFERFWRHLKKSFEIKFPFLNFIVIEFNGCKNLGKELKRERKVCMLVWVWVSKHEK